MALEQNRRKLPPMRRVAAYISVEDYEWLAGVAQRTHCTVSRFVAEVINDARAREAALYQVRRDEVPW